MTQQNDKDGSPPHLNAVDERIIKQVRTGTATYGDHGIIDSPRDVGGWPPLESKPAPPDTDHDDLPDAWEVKYGLDPNNADDRNTLADDGYTMLEKYLNSII